jgi:hypothetical protein
MLNCSTFVRIFGKYKTVSCYFTDTPRLTQFQVMKFQAYAVFKKGSELITFLKPARNLFFRQIKHNETNSAEEHC